ncbi:hypothetical protein GCM10010372_80640 [Streptomyces tauricus]|uniref:hypothetical protein n=1 Tax=Streptomyces tauricus TaxID=68274 RepID=UPI001673A056|nr:hypothetical protein [Streptomyces tauricus]GHA69014.1 hypothetical protein GCM10010372_80640 [Streptomyces tauricus]
MDQERTAKDRLSYPYNQDLSGVLRRMNRRTPFSRQRLANDPVTAAYVLAGMQLIRRHLGPGAKRVLNDPEDENSLGRPLLSFLSQRAVVAELANNPAPFPRVGTTATLRCSWRSHSDYIADLLSFGLWSLHEPALHDSRIAPDTERLLDGPEFVAAAHRLCYYDLTTVVDGPTFRLELIASAAAEGDEVIQEALAANRQGAMEPWKQVYQEMFLARGLRLRPDVSLDDFAGMLAAMASGYALRRISNPDLVSIDTSRERCIFGTAALALLLGCVERGGGTAEMSIEDAVRELVYGQPPKEGRQPAPPAAPHETERLSKTSDGPLKTSSHLAE